MIINQNREARTYSNIDDAFKTADYATGLWRCQSNLSAQLHTFADWFGVFLLVLGFGYLLGRFL